AWGKFGRAPLVTADWIYESLLNFFMLQEKLTASARSKADSVRNGWSWEATTRPLVDWIFRQS
ncbi:MAG: hypothetical protein ACYS7Y_16460, partial [Planctomycetota bacterium]